MHADIVLRRCTGGFSYLISLIAISVAGQAPPTSGPAAARPALPKPGPAPKTAWGDPDLEGTWFVMESVPLNDPRQTPVRPC